MTASERLRALDGAASAARWSNDSGNLREAVTENEAYLQGYMPGEWVHEADADVIVTLRNALPLIADVVEAAEKAHDEPYDSGIWWNAMGKRLTVLRDALQEGQEGS